MNLKILKLLIINLLCIFFLWFISDCIIFSIHNKNHEHKFSYITKPKQVWYIDLKNFFDGSDNKFRGRKPDGTEFGTKKNPITVFGCSFAHGQYLDYNQTFSYKLAYLLKRPVYNRAIPGGGIPHMYHQVISDDFYKEVPPSDTVFYIMMDGHIRRMLIHTYRITDNYFYLHYNYKNNHFQIENYTTIFQNIFKSSYTIKYIEHIYINNLIKNEKNSEKISELLLQYMIETRKELEKKWNQKISNFIIVLYEPIPYESICTEKLAKNGFKIIKAYNLTNANLNSEEYKMQDNGHPKESAWDLLTPLIIKEAGL